MNGRDGTATFLPLDSKIGGQISHDKPIVGHFQLENRLIMYIKMWKQAK